MDSYCVLVNALLASPFNRIASALSWSDTGGRSVRLNVCMSGEGKEEGGVDADKAGDDDGEESLIVMIDTCSLKIPAEVVSIRGFLKCLKQ